MNTKTKKYKVLIIVSFLLILILLCVFNKFPIVKIGKEFHTVFATELELKDKYDEIIYDNNDVDSLKRMKFLKKLELISLSLNHKKSPKH